MYWVYVLETFVWIGIVGGFFAITPVLAYGLSERKYRRWLLFLPVYALILAFGIPYLIIENS